MNLEIVDELPKDVSVDVYSHSSGKDLKDSSGNVVDPNQYKSGSGADVDWGAIVDAGADVAGALASSGLFSKSEQERMLKNVCGSRPLFGGDKKRKYQKCAEEFYRSLSMNAGLPPRGTTNQGVPYYAPTSPDSGGMSTGAKVAIGVGVLALLGTGIYFAVKASKK